MATRRPRRGWRSAGFLSIGVVVLLAGSSLIYAHWTKTLDLHVDINTGTVNLEWSPEYTDDDGVVDEPNNDAGDGVEAACDGGEQLFPDDGGGCDPSSPSFFGSPATRYDKDVASCFATRTNDRMTLELEVFNAYPSYHCSLFTDITNLGSIPVKAGAVTITVFKDGVDVTQAVNFTPFGPHTLNTGSSLGADFEFDIGQGGILCGEQIDPDDSFDISGWVHVEQGAVQGARYEIRMNQEFVNWNEWTPDLCTFNGIPPLPPPG